jgi:6-phosphofructokinase
MKHTKNIFISYHFGEYEIFITRVCYYLRKQDILTYFHKDASIPKNVPGWRFEIMKELGMAETILFFHGKKVGKTQERELYEAKQNDKMIILIQLPGCQKDESYSDISNRVFDYSEESLPLTDEVAFDCAKNCATAVGHTWIPDDDIPEGYPFDYEKAIIDVYMREAIDLNLISQGCPEKWPQVIRKNTDTDNPASEEDIGRYRDAKDPNPQVFVAAISDFEPEKLKERSMVFPLAGPRKRVHFNIRDIFPFKVGVLVSGGIAPGTNAVITSIYQRHNLYASRGGYKVDVLGYFDGFQSLRLNVMPQPLNDERLEGTFSQGGSLLGTSRVKEFVDSDMNKRDNALRLAIEKLDRDGVKILYIIGGDGSMRAAHVLWKRIKDMNRNISIAAIPKTMDNDVLWGWQTFGFESAVERANEIVHQLHVEAQSNPRLCVLQLFGSDSGYVVTHVALASGVCDLFLIPEVPFTMRKVWEFICKRIRQTMERGDPGFRTHGLILMAEAAIPLDAKWYLDDEKYGFTQGEKMEVEHYLQINYWDRPPLGIQNNQIKKIRSYLGLDKKIPYKEVKPLDRFENDILREYAKNLRTQGQTPDDLRSAGLKLVSRVLQYHIRNDETLMPEEYWQNFRVFTNEPRHLIRAVDPTSSDILFGQRLGTLAVDGAMAGYTDFMISQWLTEYVMVPLRLVILGRKRVPEKGIFYRSAIACTGQPANLI